MSLMLAELAGQSLLASFAPHLRGCNLSTRVDPVAHAEKYHLWQNRIWVWSEADPAKVRFFPEIRYRGCKVYPEWWHRESSEPLLAVHLPPRDLDFSKFFVRPPTLDDLQRAMEADGWQGDGREGWHKYVHVDELEKIEGPPPEGPF